MAAVLYEDRETGFAAVSLGTHSGPQTAAGDLAPVHPGEVLRLHGTWQVHPRFGRQFRAEWAERMTPTTGRGLERYLGSGAFPGIGPAYARRVVQHFGASTLQALEEGEKRLRQVPGLGRKRAKALAEAFRDSRDRHRVLAELRGLGLSSTQTGQLYERWQAGAIERVRKDPFALIGELPGIGLETAEKLAKTVGMPPDSPARARGVALHWLREAAREGHSCLPRPLLEHQLTVRGIPAAAAELALRELEDQGRVRIEGAGHQDKYLYLSRLWEDEAGLARHLRRLLGAPSGAVATPEQVLAALRRASLRPDEGQRAALDMALLQPLSVLTGGPGTGKTTTLRLLLDILEAGGWGPVAMASPTGRAAKRLQEATGRGAGTVHRLLGFEPRSSSFRHDEKQALDLRYLIVDEVSMLDLPLAHALLRAVPAGCRVLLVGDADQLPSVGPGSVLRDLVGSPSVPHTRLQRIHRQGEDSGIVEAAHAVLAGRVPRSAPFGERGDFFVVARADAPAAAELVERLVCERIPRRYGMDPLNDVLVLSPMYRGPLGVDELNRRLGARLNPGGAGAEWCAPFRAGDRVMAVRNDYEREVFNGDTGRVLQVLEGELLVDMGGRPQTYDRDGLADLVPAWCVTVHRAQGSEARAVVLVLDRSHYLLLRRNLLYTAITRGKELVVVVADPGALRRAVANASESRRYGRLAERLAQSGATSSSSTTRGR